MARRNPIDEKSIKRLIALVDEMGDAKIVLSPGPLDITTLNRVEWHAQKQGRKPDGLWYGCNAEWLRFIKSESYAASWLLEYDYAYRLHITSYRRILKIDTLAKIKKFTATYGSDDAIDWQEVARKYGGIEICPYLDKYRYTGWYYGWDVASGCVWDPTTIAGIEEIWRSDDMKKNPIQMLGEAQSNPAHRNPWEVRSDSGLEGVFADEDDARFYAEEIRGSGARGVSVDRRERGTRPRLPRHSLQNPSDPAWQVSRSVTNVAQGIGFLGGDPNKATSYFRHIGVEVQGVGYGWLERCYAEPSWETGKMAYTCLVELTDGQVDAFAADEVWPVAGRYPESPRRRRNPSSRLFSGVYPTGIAYADKARERDGDYLRVAFLPFSTLRLQWSPGNHPAELREEIERDAAQIIARRGQPFEVSSSGQTVILGGEQRRPSGAPPQYHSPMGRPPGVPNPGRVLRESNPAGLTAKGERMYEDIKAGYGRDPRAAEIASRTVLARARTTRGLKKR